MGIRAEASLYDDLMRLDEAAASAGCAMACTYQTFDELHRDAIQRYFAMHPRRRPFGLAIGVTALVAFLALL